MIRSPDVRSDERTTPTRRGLGDRTIRSLTADDQIRRACFITGKERQRRGVKTIASRQISTSARGNAIRDRARLLLERLLLVCEEAAAALSPVLRDDVMEPLQMRVASFAWAEASSPCAAAAAQPRRGWSRRDETKPISTTSTVKPRLVKIITVDLLRLLYWRNGWFDSSPTQAALPSARPSAADTRSRQPRRQTSATRCFGMSKSRPTI